MTVILAFTSALYTKYLTRLVIRTLLCVAGLQLQNAVASYSDVWLVIYEDGIAVLDRQTMVM